MKAIAEIVNAVVIVMEIQFIFKHPFGSNGFFIFRLLKSSRNPNSTKYLEEPNALWYERAWCTFYQIIRTE